MKKLLIALLSLTLLLTACTSTKTPEKDFKFNSFEWGDSWENVKASSVFEGVDTQILSEDQRVLAVTATDIDFYGFTVDAGFSFGNDGASDYCEGLYTVMVKYDEADEDAIKQKLTDIYGEPQTFFLDKNGIENPITPAGWYTEERLETSLDDDAMEVFMAKLDGMEPTRADAILRQPLVMIQIFEENNLVTYSASDAAIVRTLNK